MSHFLDKIRPDICKRVETLEIPKNLEVNHLDFCDIFKGSNDQKKPTIIAEIKFASPSAGRIYTGPLSHQMIAASYLNGGASALSILAEPTYFQGDIQYIQDVRLENPKAHLLLKDFVLSKAQIAQGLLKGANAVLLIVAFLTPQDLKELYTYARSLGLTPLIEVHNEQELDMALDLNPQVIGINNRNLKTLAIDLNTSKELIQKIPSSIYAVCESGIQTTNQMKDMMDVGFSGFLIGSAFMKQLDPGKALELFLKA